ncbi:MAG: BREX system P-loop protein BrxC, partial [Ferruginibacter sp.]
FQEYLASKPINYRLVFLVDEVSQYVGQNKDLLLNLQTIVEMVSQYLNNQVWVACTAQQDLAEVVQGVDSADHRDEFGKILGRFDTRISLESNDPTYITQKRVLDKNAKGHQALSELYRSNKDAIEHQLDLGSSLYRGYKNEDDFQLSYPFIPYQFKLIGDVLDSFKQLRFVIEQVKDNARSVIGITHFTVKQSANKEVGSFIPFDAFMNDQLRQNMQNAGTRALDRPLGLPWIKKDSFEERVVKNLFMISNLNHSVIQTFPPNVENLTTLMMTKLDENKLELQKKIKDIISRLRDENIVREEEGRFFFYNEDEINVTNLIGSQHVNAEQKFTELDQTFFRKILKIDPKFSIGKNDFRISYWVDDKEIFRTGDIKVSLHVLDDQSLDSKNLHTPADELIIGINEWFYKDQQLRKDFEWFCKTKTYLLNSGAAATGERKKTNENFALRNKQMEESIATRIIQQFVKTRFISQQRIMESNEINGSNPKDRYADALEKHLLLVYNRIELANDYAFTEQDLRTAVRNPQIPLPELTPAETLVNDYISSNGNTASVEDLVNKFDKRPFGWKHTQVIHILVMLQKKKKREFEYQNEPRYNPADFVEKAINSKERSRCVVSSAEEISAEEIDNTIAAFREIFNQDIPHTSDGNKLFGDIIDWAKQYKKANEHNLQTYYGKYPFGEHLFLYDEMLKNWIEIRDIKKMFDSLIAGKGMAKQWHDNAKAIQDFINRMLPEYEKMGQFVAENRNNFTLLSYEDVSKSEELVAYLVNHTPQTDFRHKKKLVEELKASINDLIIELQQKATERYNKIFDELEREADNKEVERINVLPDRETKFRQIKKSNSISELQLLVANAASYKSGILQTILKLQSEREATAAKAKGKSIVVSEPVEFYISSIRASISNETELNEFLDSLKTSMLKLLNDNKTIIIKE